jgi:glutathione synthase/RimK-type ligase-like ATP-grasp enzyme
MKKVLILFGKSDWEKAKPFSNKDYQYSYEFFYSLCKENGVQMYRASYEWYDYKKHVFKHAWIYNAPGGKWERVENIKPDLIYDKTKGHPEAYYKKDLMVAHYTFINDLTFTRLIDDKFVTGLLFATWSKENTIVRTKQELLLALKKISTEKAVLKPISESGGRGVRVFQVEEAATIQFSREHILQEFIDSSRGVPGVKIGTHDLRLVFVNDAVVYAYIRTPQEGAFLANLAQGGSLTIVPKEKIPKSVQPIVKHAKKIFASFDPKIYTIDLMFDEAGTPWVIELNSMPGLYFTPEEKPSMEKMYQEILTIFKKSLHIQPK